MWVNKTSRAPGLKPENGDVLWSYELNGHTVVSLMHFRGKWKRNGYAVKAANVDDAKRKALEFAVKRHEEELVVLREALVQARATPSDAPSTGTMTREPTGGLT